MKLLLAFTVLPLLLAGAAMAQDHAAMPGMTMPGMQTAPAKAHAPAKAPAHKRRAKTKATRRAATAAAPAAAQARPGAMPNGSKAMSGDMPGMDMSQSSSGASADAASGMTMPGMSAAGMDMASDDAVDIPKRPPPPPPKDRVADRFYGKAAMDRAAAELRNEHGGERVSRFMLNVAELQSGSGKDGYRWDGEARYGGDINRFVVKSEGAATNGEGLEAGEVQALYSRAVGVYTDVQVGVRHDFAPHPTKTYLAAGVETLLPLWLQAEGSLFLSNKGDLSARGQAYYDLRLTQRWILQTRGEINLAASDDPETLTGSGVTNAELGLRLRYDIRRSFSPYIGVSWDKKLGRTADYARLAGQKPEQTSLVVGIRTFF